MKKKTSARTILLLLAVSVVIYSIQIILFHDTHDTLFYMLQDWAFLPIQIVVVTIITGSIIDSREKAERLAKTSMLSSTFFSEIGNELLRLLLKGAENPADVRACLPAAADIGSCRLQDRTALIKKAPLPMSFTPEMLEALKIYLCDKRMALMVLISNPLLLEHEDFTDMLWAIFHITDELTARTDLQQLPDADLAHLNGDISRVLRGLLINWLSHMDHIRREYPYLYQLEQMTGPAAGSGTGQ